MPTTYAFGKGGYSNVSKDNITKAIDTFASVACTGQFTSLTIDERNVLVLAFMAAGAGAYEIYESETGVKPRPSRISVLRTLDAHIVA
jgi:hypothetical protein